MYSSRLTVFTIIGILFNVSGCLATRVNLTESCSYDQHHCTLAKLISALGDPLIIAKSNETTQPNLTEIILRNSNLPVIPFELFQLLPNLQTFLMHKCGLQRIQARDFISAAKLKVLILQNNRLSELPEELFAASARDLSEIRLTNNHILHIHAKAFAGLNYLKTLDLGVNNIHQLLSDVFAPLVNLEFIDLSHNSIEKIDSNTFARNSKLKTIILNDNKFIVFASNSLRHLPHLYMLDVSYNKINEIQLKSVDTLLVQSCEMRRCVIDGSVVRLRASNNFMQGITISDKSSVKEIEVHGNLIASLDDFVGMKNLQKLDISRNHLSSLITVESPTFLPLPSLNYLNIASNQIRNITADSFLALTKLAHLDVAFNRLINLGEQIFEPLRNLEKLYIEGNRLHNFDYENFTRSHPLLREMGIFNNEWEFTLMRAMVAHLKENGVHLSVRYNPNDSIELHSSPSSSLVTASSHSSYDRHYTTEYMDNDIKTTERHFPGTVSSSIWTKRDILTVTILCFVLLILLMHLYKILKEENCFSRFERTIISRHRPTRLGEDDSEV